MNIVIIGSGNVATHLAKALLGIGVNVLQVWSKNFEHAKALSEQTGAEPINDLSKVVQADFCFVAIKDDVIAEVVRQLKHFKGIIAHTAGFVSVDVFKNTAADYGVFYPLQTFSKNKAISFTHVPLCIEANNRQTKVRLLSLAKKLSQKVFEINSAQRKILHLAAVFACNFPNHLYNLSAQLLNAHQIDFDIIRPLILETAQKVQNNLPGQVQTGPAVRGDEQTIRQHLLLLNDWPIFAELYALLSNSIKSSK